MSYVNQTEIFGKNPGANTQSRVTVSPLGHVNVDASLEGEVIEGTITKLHVTDITATSLLTDILKELQKITLHLSMLTDININNTEVE